MASWNGNDSDHNFSLIRERLDSSRSRYGSYNEYSDYGDKLHDNSNQSPFLRDVSQIMRDDGPLRELWDHGAGGAHPPRGLGLRNSLSRAYSGGGGGTTSRRHSVSVVQPVRRGRMGRTASMSGGVHPHVGSSSGRTGIGRGSLMISDEDLLDAGAPMPDLRMGMHGGMHPVDALNSNFGMMNLNDINQSLPGHQYHEKDSTHASQEHTPQQHTQPPPPGNQPQGPNGLGAGTSYASHARSTSQSQQQGGSSPTMGRGMGIPPQGFYSQHPSAQPQQGPTYTQAHAHQQSQPQPEHALGRGVPLSAVPHTWKLFIVEFKAGRTDLFYLTDASDSYPIKVGDLVIVEADRGRDLGRVVNDNISVDEVEAWLDAGRSSSGQILDLRSTGSKKEINPKQIYGKAGPAEASLLAAKMSDEMKALQLCQSKVRAKKLPMEVVDAEYQWDRRKLTFYFVADKRIDFRELVRELFRLYKTRIWMASLQGGGGVEP
ncbi:PSP1 C-terminal conserved region-domain-containing protein [Lentinula aff. lateritia]|uniref:PSP1 C-terminal conserved region-domain-containing protein n=1 Tax=Lentinula aff. lateritia TaxID=2804960 RepID=A0ACC1TN54_9AGAR|nr:PSP1 C-terminal conserved region-domain-containing protein [Lentinula aff. lateritia]